MMASARLFMPARQLWNYTGRRPRTIATTCSMEPPQLWVILRPVERDPPYELAIVTADPAEGEGMTEAGEQICRVAADAGTIAGGYCGIS